MANNDQSQPEKQPAPESKRQQIAAIFNQILRHMPYTEQVKKDRKRRQSPLPADLLADPQSKERTRRIVANSPKPIDEPEPPKRKNKPNKGKTDPADGQSG